MFFIYDISNLDSFQSLNFFLNSLKDAKAKSPNLKIYLIGNFLDKDE